MLNQTWLPCSLILIDWVYQYVSVYFSELTWATINIPFNNTDLFLIWTDSIQL